MYRGRSKNMQKDVAEHFDKIAKGHKDIAYRNPYAMNAIRLRIVHDMLNDVESGKLLDAGCGDGVPLLSFLEKGWDAYGIDQSINMVKEAQIHIEQKGYNKKRVLQKSLLDLKTFADNSFDVVTCLGVMYYVKDDVTAYKHINRILKPGGIFICSQQNELFDLFTFNKYTLRFFNNNIMPLVCNEERNRLLNQMSKLITNPKEPIRHDKYSARDIVFTRAENPLIYHEKLSQYNFVIKSAPVYFGIHILPPLIMNKYSWLKEKSDHMQYELRNDWRSLFMGAHFLIKAMKNE